MKHRFAGHRRLNLTRMYALVALLVPLLAACGGPAAPPVTGNATAATKVAGTTSTSPSTGASTAVAATAAPGGSGSAATTATTGSTTVSAATATTAQTMPATTAANTTQAGAAASSQPAPPDQQVLRAQWGEPATLDPQAISSANDQAVVEDLFTGLTRFTPDLTPVPAIAASWQFNPDHTQITFKLRATQWSDGRPLTAGDFVYAWRRLADPRTASPSAYFITGVVKGATALSSTPVSDTAKLQQAVANLGVKALDPRTLQVTLEKPVPFFPSIAANLLPLRQDVVEPSGAKWATPGHLIGNGPFVLKSWTKGSELTLAPNPTYYAGAPKLTALTFKFIYDPAVAFTTYQAGALDISAVPPAEIPRVRSDPQLKDQVYQTSLLQTLMLRFTATKPPFNDIRVRQAFAAAIDRQTLVQQVLHGVGTPAYSFIPPGIPGHLSAAEARAGGQFYDPAQAQHLLATAGYPGGKGFPALKLPYRNSGYFPAVMQRVQADLQNNLHITITLDPRVPKTFFHDMSVNPTEIYDSGFVAAFPDPSDAEANFDPGSYAAKGGNPAFKKLIDEAERQRDPDKRIALYKQAEQVLAQDAPAIFLFWGANFRMVKPYVKGVVVTPRAALPGQGDIKAVYIVKH